MKVDYLCFTIIALLSHKKWLLPSLQFFLSDELMYRCVDDSVEEWNHDVDGGDVEEGPYCPHSSGRCLNDNRVVTLWVESS